MVFTMNVIKKTTEVVMKANNLSDLLNHQAISGSQTIVELRNQIKQCVEHRQTGYEKYILNEIDNTTFQEIKDECSNQIKRLETQISIANESDKEAREKQKITAIANEALNESATQREIVDKLIEKILVYPSNQIEIIWKFANFAMSEETKEVVSAGVPNSKVELNT